MKLITQRELIRGVAAKWREQYAPNGKWLSVGAAFDKREVYERLRELDGETVAAEQVDGIIGNGSWTSLRCDDCDVSVGAVVEVGQPPDYESATARLCEACARKAAAAFGDAR